MALRHPFGAREEPDLIVAYEVDDDHRPGRVRRDCIVEFRSYGTESGQSSPRN